GSAAVSLAAVLRVAGCGPSATTGTHTTTTSIGSGATASTAATTTAQASAPGALQAEANSAATGDIPDNQVFLVFRDQAAGWSMKYPEGWAQSGSGDKITFRDKNNVVRVAVAGGATATPASARRDLARVRGTHVEAAP